jgi:hypothetical protein
MRYASIAVWDRNRAITAIAIFVWGTNVVFLIQGKSFPPPSPFGRLTV